MEEKVKQIVGAFLIGVLLPGTVFRTGVAVTPLDAAVTIPSESQTVQDSVIPPMGEHLEFVSVLQGEDILKLELETYVLGVLMAEMPADFSMEALKAQAVAGRTCALRCRDMQNKHPDGAICTDSGCCQAYMSVQAYEESGATPEMIQKMVQAVTETAGEVLTYEGELIEATYFSCSGGKTEDALAVWGTDVPYLQSVVSPGEEGADIFRNTVTFTAKEFASRLGRQLTGTPKDWFGAVSHTRGGGVATMMVAGKLYFGTQLRSLLSLNSTAFTVTVSGDIISVTTSGRGHRVGMSQYGADAMAVAGSTYEGILAYYYPGTRIDKLETVG